MLDWDAIETEWRFSKRSNVKIGKDFGVSEGAIRKRAKKENWVKGERPGDRQEPRKNLVPAKPKPKDPDPAENQDPEPDEIDDPQADLLAMGKRLLKELDFMTAHIDELEDDIYQETMGDRDCKRRQSMLKAVSLPSRATTLKTIQQTLAAAQLKELPEGKKGQQQQAAKGVGSGKFGASRPPLKAVK